MEVQGEKHQVCGMGISQVFVIFASDVYEGEVVSQLRQMEQ